jgi:hypothetical protein
MATFEENKTRATNIIDTYKTNNANHWWNYNSRLMNVFFGGNVVFSLGATIAGVMNHAWIAAGFGALAAATLAVQRNYNFDMRTQWYGKAISRCDRFLELLEFRAQNNDDINRIMDAFDAMRSEEGSWGASTTGTVTTTDLNKPTPPAPQN